MLIEKIINGKTNGEINLTDAMNLAAQRGVPLTGVLCRGLRFDCGTNDELAKSNLKLSLMFQVQASLTHKQNKLHHQG